LAGIAFAGDGPRPRAGRHGVTAPDMPDCYNSSQRRTMLYRPFGKTGEQVSILGFGCMRLPVIDRKMDQIDIPLATTLLRYAIDNGVNYVDTAYSYHGDSLIAPGNSEAFVGHALGDGYRDKVLVATKLPVWAVKERADMDRVLAHQLDRLRTDRIDCYLLHGIGLAGWQALHENGAIDFLDKAKKDGRIRYAGFSFHGETSDFKPIVDAYDWDFCQIQYNYMDTEYQAGFEGLRYAAEWDLGMVIMEPLKGGRLANLPEEVRAIFDRAAPKRSTAEWAFRFIWDDPGVSVVLSGMGAMDQVVENVRVAASGEAVPNSLTAEERAVIDEVKEAFRGRIRVDCTSCKYCMPCPSGINIPLVFECLNKGAMYGAKEMAKFEYGIGLTFNATKRASECTQCGQCQDACPQNIAIPDLMELCSQEFDE
jgi:uncharacterized protein